MRYSHEYSWTASVSNYPQNPIYMFKPACKTNIEHLNHSFQKKSPSNETLNRANCKKNHFE